MWYSIKKDNYNITVRKETTEDDVLKVWLENHFSCSEGKTTPNKLIDNKEINITIPNSNEFSLYELHIEVGRHKAVELIPYYPTLFKDLIEDLEYVLCQCACQDCEECIDGRELLSITTKTILYYSLTSSVYKSVFSKALECIGCDVNEKAICLLLSQKIHGNKLNTKLLRKLLGVYYLTFYFYENINICNKDYNNSIFKFDKIEKCLISMGLDIKCVKDKLETSIIVTGDYNLLIDNRSTKVIGKECFLETSPLYKDELNRTIKKIKINKIDLSGKDDNKDKLTLDGVDIYEGQIINFKDIESGKLIFTAKNSDKDSKSSFDWSVVDFC